MANYIELVRKVKIWDILKKVEIMLSMLYKIMTVKIGPVKFLI